jgi:hypothetical protein
LPLSFAAALEREEREKIDAPAVFPRLFMAISNNR